MSWLLVFFSLAAFAGGPCEEFLEGQKRFPPEFSKYLKSIQTDNTVEASDLDPRRLPPYESLHKEMAKDGIIINLGIEFAPDPIATFSLHELKVTRDYDLTYRLTSARPIVEVGENVPVALVEIRTYDSPVTPFRKFWKDELVGIQQKIFAANNTLAPRIFGIVRNYKGHAYLATELMAALPVEGTVIGSNFMALENFLMRVEGVTWPGLSKSMQLKNGPATSLERAQLYTMQFPLFRAIENGRYFIDLNASDLIPDPLLTNTQLFPTESQPDLNAVNGRLTLERAHLLTQMKPQQQLDYLKFLKEHKNDCWKTLVVLLHNHREFIYEKSDAISNELKKYLERYVIE